MVVVSSLSYLQKQNRLSFQARAGKDAPFFWLLGRTPAHPYIRASYLTLLLRARSDPAFPLVRHEKRPTMPSSIQTGPSTAGLQLLAIPVVCLLVLFLGYSSQWLFHTAEDLGPGRPSTTETVVFNLLLACLWWTYFKACTVDPGRYVFPLRPSAVSKTSSGSTASANTNTSTTASTAVGPTTGREPTPAPAPAPGTRWCKKCARPKPPRAHHCRHCGRCVPKMDHHCPWTGNCVGLQTFPHFLRFLLFTNLALWALGRLLAARFARLWADRHLPAYLGPTAPQLVHLTLLGLVTSATALVLVIMLVTTARSWVLNATMIEGWELERHDARADRAAPAAGGFWDGGDSDREDHDRDAAGGPPDHVEFPYDIGFFANMAQAMGTRNVLLWFWPLAGGPRVDPAGAGAGWTWEENGLNARSGLWPPPDRDKARWTRQTRQDDSAARGWGTPEEERAAFRARQARDLRRWRQHQGSGIVGELGDDDDEAAWEGRPGNIYRRGHELGVDGEPGWTNSDGDRLRDYGVDEDADGDDTAAPVDVDQQDEDVPLGELLRRRKAARANHDEAT